MNIYKQQLSAQIIAFTLAAFGISCCLCGWLYSLTAWLGNESTTVDKQPTIQMQRMVIGNGYLCTIIALMFLLAGLILWVFYGRSEYIKKRGIKTVVALLLIGSLGFCLWSGLVYWSFPVTQLMVPVPSELTSIMAILPSLLCMFPAVLMVIVSGCIWYFFIREHNFAPSNEFIE